MKVKMNDKQKTDNSDIRDITYEDEYFYDTCILIEILLNNKNFQKYKDKSVLITNLNIMEYLYYLIKNSTEENKINSVINELKDSVIDYDYELMIEAAKMKYKCRNEKLSFADCIGYLLARKKRCKFLTCDSKFKNKKNVEFIEK